MTAAVQSIWRHPIKAHGREALDQVTLTAGQTMPGDRVWAIAHEASKADGSEWAAPANFSRGAKAPALMAISARYDAATGMVTLMHPDRPDLTVQPDRDAQALIDWAAPLMPEGRAASVRVVRLPGRGMTDTPFPSISILNLASNRALEQAMGHDLSIHRWRGNIWTDLGSPWAEFDLVGKDIAIGDCRFRVRERITRCLATTANPDTGERDADTLGALKANWDHTDFGIYAEVAQSGEIRVGDDIRVL
jgi:hypothetical protein